MLFFVIFATFASLKHTLKNKTMKTQQKNVLWIVVVAILAYVIGAYIGFPFVQTGMGTGDVGGIRRANKQQELMNSPADLKLAEKYQTDTNYRNMLSAGYGILYVQTKATVATIESLKKQTGSVKELASYSDTMDEITEVGNQLSSMLEGGLQGLKAVSEKKSAENLTFKLSQSLNLFQLMNSRLADLEEFSQKTQQLAAQKKINDDVLKTYSEFLIESADIASSCGDNTRATKTLGMAVQMHISPSIFNTPKNVAVGYSAVAGTSTMVNMCGQRTSGVIKDIFLHLQENSPMVGKKDVTNTPMVGMVAFDPILMSRDAGSMALTMSQMENVGRIERYKPLTALTAGMNSAIMGLTVGTSGELKSQAGNNSAGKNVGRQERNIPLSE